jgi:hypothetical protein
MPPESQNPYDASIPGKKTLRKTPFIVLAVLGCAIASGLVCLGIFLRPAPPIEMPLGDGRILHIEGVTLGTQHRMGSSSVLERFRPWLPGRLAAFFGMDRAANTITLDRPGLVVWVNAISSVTATNVDCQGIRMEFADRNGDLFGPETSSWFGGQGFWRVGHVFYSYPRDERELKLQVTTWRGGKISSAQVPNPHVFQRANWVGNSLPLSTNVGGMEIRLRELIVRTNGGQQKYWEVPAKYFEPVWECRQTGKPAAGWAEPEWFAEDPNGNRGQFLGVRQPVLRFFATAYPESTNSQVAQLLATLPQTELTTLSTNLWWNKTNSIAANQVVVLGLFLRGTHTFSEGNYESSSTAVLGPSGGSPSGWTGMSRRINPLRVKETHSHYTPSPVLYLRYACPATNPNGLPAESGRLVVRLRDDHGNYWVAKAENAVDGINPFLVEVPPGVTNLVPEVVWLKPVQANFFVETKEYLKP